MDRPVCKLLATFAALTALFFGHTSHRAFLDVYLIVFATVPVMRLWPGPRTAGFE